MSEPALRMYVDENGNYNLREDLTSESNRYLCLIGVIMKITAHSALTNELNALKVKYFGSAEIVSHRRELIAATPPFESLKDETCRTNFNEDLLQIMSSASYRVISVVIDKKALVDRYTILIKPYVLYSASCSDKPIVRITLLRWGNICFKIVMRTSPYMEQKNRRSSLNA